MRKYVYIGFGGFLGAALRFAVKNINFDHHSGNISYGTLFVNVSGCFLLAFIMTSAFTYFNMDADLRLGVATGFLGAYTTFSTLCKETSLQLENGLYLSAFYYIELSVILGFAAAFAGIALARAIAGMIAKKRISNAGEKFDDSGGVL